MCDQIALPGLFPIQCGMDMPANNENPKMNTFLDEDKSQYFKLEMPTPVTRPNMIQNRPPLIGILRLESKATRFYSLEPRIYIPLLVWGSLTITGFGIVTKKAENFASKPKIIKIKAATCIILLDAAYFRMR